MGTEYNHDYATCAETYATLCIYHRDLDPDEVSRLLALEPTKHQRRGEVNNPHARKPFAATVGAWFLTTEGAVQSRDVRCHLDWLLGKLLGKEAEFRQLRRQCCELKISCYWVSASGHGGPAVGPDTMGRLAELGIELWFDVYFHGEEGVPA
jgi:hypothetical protein